MFWEEYKKGFNDNFVIMSSLKVNYCDRYLSVIRPSISLSVSPSTISSNDISFLEVTEKLT